LSDIKATLGGFKKLLAPALPHGNTNRTASHSRGHHLPPVSYMAIFYAFFWKLCMAFTFCPRKQISAFGSVSPFVYAMEVAPRFDGPQSA